MDRSIGIDVDIAEICFDLVEHVPFRISQSFCYIRMDPQRRMSDVVDLF